MNAWYLFILLAVWSMHAGSIVRRSRFWWKVRNQQCTSAANSIQCLNNWVVSAGRWLNTWPELDYQRTLSSLMRSIFLFTAEAHEPIEEEDSFNGCIFHYCKNMDLIIGKYGKMCHRIKQSTGVFFIYTIIFHLYCLYLTRQLKCQSSWTISCGFHKWTWWMWGGRDVRWGVTNHCPHSSQHIVMQSDETDPVKSFVIRISNCTDFESIQLTIRIHLLIDQ